MAVITIDGTRLEVPDGKSVLDCALDAGIYIPHLCHHKDLSPLGSCRMCVVEVEGKEGVTTSCDLKAEDGLVITTRTPELERLRTLALELLLAGHPEDCSTCPKYGNCELQMLIQYIGPKTGRLKMRTKGFKPQEENPLYLHDMNRCILCGRCVRACNELRGVKVLQYQKKEMETYVGTLHDKLLKDADCRFCGACAEVCPTGTIRDKIVYSAVERQEKLVPCRNTCPAMTDVPRYIRYVKEGKYDEAAAVIRERVPFPKALGHVCSHVCESECRRQEVNASVSIRNIKRYAAEKDTGKYWMQKGKQLPDTGKKVCIVGAGPAGMTAAYYLRKQGHDVTVKEALPKAGGMLQYGIPSYRMPREELDEEINYMLETGIQLETNTKVEDVNALKNEFDAVLVCIGNHVGTLLPMEGNDAKHILLNIDFLRNASMGKETGLGKKVIVLGGGNVAFDCARTAKRLGAEEIHVACLEARDKMTADDEEIEQAIEEGIFVHPAQAFEKIMKDEAENVSGVAFRDIASFTFDENRRAIIEKVEDSYHEIEADTVIFAVGQRCGLPEEAGLARGRANSIAADAKTCKTDVEGIYACGDVTYGTKSVILAIADGRKAAENMDLFLGGDGDISEALAPVEPHDAWIGKVEGFGYEERRKTEVLSPEERKNNFNMVDKGICDAEICGEASRCLQCDLRMDISKPRLWGDFSEKKEA